LKISSKLEEEEEVVEEDQAAQDLHQLLSLQLPIPNQVKLKILEKILQDQQESQPQLLPQEHKGQREQNQQRPQHQQQPQLHQEEDL